MLKLSICMMVKDEEKSLRRCLESIEHLIERKDIELIIVDTGSSDNTVEIAKRFTDRVYFHEWNQNFSEMRNITLSYANGEWVMILDADEVLENYEEVLSLFDNNTINNYNAVKFYIKSLKKSYEQDFSILAQERIFRRQGFHYANAVHNNPIFEPPSLNSNISLLHYGYVIDDKELMEKKFKRTSTLLIKELEKDPTNVYFRHQLANSYALHGEDIKAIEEIRKAYKLLKTNKKKIESIYLFGSYSTICHRLKYFEEAKQICEEGIKLKPDYIDLYYYLCATYLDMGNTTKMLEVFNEYLGLYKNKENLEITNNSAIVLFSTTENKKQQLINEITAKLIEVKLYEEALKTAQLIANEKVRISIVINLLLKLENYSDILIRYEQTDYQMKEFFIQRLENELATFNQAIRDNVHHIFFFIFRE